MNETKIECLVDIEMMKKELSLSDLDKHIDLIKELMLMSYGRKKHRNFIGCGIQADVYKIVEGYVLKMYIETYSKSTLDMYDFLEDSNCEILAKNYAILYSYDYSGTSYAFVIQEELNPLNNFCDDDDIYKNKTLIIDFLKKVYEVSNDVMLNDIHSGNIGITKDGKLKLLDFGLCGIEQNMKKWNLEYALCDFRMYGWFKSFVSKDIRVYSGIKEKDFDSEEVYEKMIFALEGLL